MAEVLVLNGNPKADGLCAALAHAYAAGARNGGATVRLVPLADLTFDDNLRHGYDERLPLEPDLVALQEQLREARHLALITPVWWGTMPARLKGLFDRVLLPGFAFRYEKGSARPAQLLRGRTARLLLTMDSPVWYYRWIMGDPLTKTLARATLGFCGIRVRQVHRLGPVITSSALTRRGWIDAAHRAGIVDATRVVDRRPAPVATAVSAFPP